MAPKTDMSCENIDRDPWIDHQEALSELVRLSGLSTEQVIEHSIHALHRAWIGNDPCQIGTPFTKMHSDKDADIVLRQIDPTTFVVAEGFRFGGELFPAGEKTDLASVPSRLTWLVARYGRHSLPAIVHDRRINEKTPPALRELYDEEFRDNMNEMKVPFVQRWFMWAAVALGTMFKRTLPVRLATGAWALGYGILACVISVFLLHDLMHLNLRSRTGLVILVALVSPLVLSVLWSRRYLLGLISAYSLLVIVVPTIAVAVAWIVYRTVETASKLPLKWLGQPAHPISPQEALLTNR